MEIQPIMEKLSNYELSRLFGGEWTNCDMVIIAANADGSNWNETQWNSWIEAYDRLCAKVDFVYDPTTGEWTQP